MSSRSLSLALLVALAACNCETKYRPEKLTKDAETLFLRAEEPGPGGSLVVDLEQLRALGLIKPSDPKSASAAADLLMFLLPGVATELKDQPTGPLAARAAVLVGILRDWAPWPHVERVGLLVPPPMPGAGAESLVEGTTLVVATKDGKKDNDELLKGLAAMDRATGMPQFKSENGDLCLASQAVPLAVCIRAGDGFFALSSPNGLKSLMPGEGAPRPAAPPPSIIRLRLEVPLVGKGTVTISGESSVKVAALVDAADPKMAEMLEKMANEYLARLDQNRADTRAVMAPALQQTQTALAADNDAPPAMKKVAAQMTLDGLLDPGGSYQQLRQSIKVSRDGGKVAFEFTIPEQTVRRVRDDSSLLVSVAVAGVFAAVAVPNFLKYQCHAKQAEAKANLGALLMAERAYKDANGHWATTFDDLNFKPEGPTLYTYCLAGGCHECTKPGCLKVEGEENPCVARAQMMQEMGDESFFACAVGSPDEQDDLDVWFIDENGDASNVENDCE